MVVVEGSREALLYLGLTTLSNLLVMNPRQSKTCLLRLCSLISKAIVIPDPKPKQWYEKEKEGESKVKDKAK